MATEVWRLVQTEKAWISGQAAIAGTAFDHPLGRTPKHVNITVMTDGKTATLSAMTASTVTIKASSDATEVRLEIIADGQHVQLV